jgi:hypothetical protein
MPNDTTDQDREQRRRAIIRRRRAREAADVIATNTGEIKDLKEKRPPETAIRNVQTIPADTVAVSDSVSTTVRTASAAQYGSSKYGQSAYASANVD